MRERIRKLFGEFKAFAVRGNVMDLAVGVIIGGAFSKIISSLVTDIATPFLGMFLGGVRFADWTIELPRLFGQEKPNLLNVGAFVNTVIEFFILSVVVFAFVKAVNVLRKKQEEEKKPPEPSPQERLLAEIRDILKEMRDR